MDTPVKHYSSGMYGRLAFAVALVLLVTGAFAFRRTEPHHRGRAVIY
jgi:hypothetical protein